MKNFTQRINLRGLFICLFIVISGGLSAQDITASNTSPVAMNAKPATAGASFNESNASPVEVTTYPNPFVDRVNFKINSRVSGPATVEIFDMTGRRLAVPFAGNVKAGETHVVEYKVDGVTPRNPIIFKIKIGPNGVVGQVVRFH